MYYIIVCYIALYYLILYYVILCYIKLYFRLLYSIILYYITLNKYYTYIRMLGYRVVTLELGGSHCSFFGCAAPKHQGDIAHHDFII